MAMGYGSGLRVNDEGFVVKIYRLGVSGLGLWVMVVGSGLVVGVMSEWFWVGVMVIG